MKRFIYITILCVGAYACQKEKQFPIEPKIAFKEYLSYGNDSADCYISFEDGDGDIGAMGGNKSPNLRMLYLYKNKDSIFIPYDAAPGTATFDTLYYEYVIPFATPDGQYKALQGDILIKLRTAPLYHPLHKVVKFDITLWDRAGNKSNTVSTKEIYTK